MQNSLKNYTYIVRSSVAVLCIFIMIMIVSIEGMAQTATDTVVYTIKKGDTLSEVIWSLRPDQQLYGGRGNLQRVLTFNPELGPDGCLIAGQTIKLPVSLLRVSTGEAAPASAQIQTPERKIASELPDLQELNPELMLKLSASYGACLIGLKQSGAFADLNAFSIALDLLRIQAQTNYGHVFGSLEFSTYSLQLRTDTTKRDL